ncbi:hypothetical protein QBC35DRAFT_221500 [Podospora australis]|uniref:F-box domain-containing protein n=1 Tax=Podospora australis TaxID=1536484 RepID=A0AAN6WUI5_9PEZI|nr:hypothetical protein QBC35DRAFT_221500 [Podospora australis]
MSSSNVPDSILYRFPPEILNTVIQLLDPIALIALAQTSKRLRQYINPEDYDFEQRLLALELLPEFGGDHWTSSAASNLQDLTTFPRYQAYRKLHKFACFGCGKLLPHFMFTEDAMYSIETGKPHRHSTLAMKLWFTDWKPDHQEPHRDKSDRRTQRDAYNASTRRLEYYGHDRLKRRCHECTFQDKRGEDGSAVQVSCPILGQRQLERFYPGLVGPRFSGLSSYKWTAGGAWPYKVRLYSIRCPGCEKWQERRAFGSIVMTLSNDLVFDDDYTECPECRAVVVDQDSALCHYCYTRVFGRNDKTAARFARPMFEMLRHERNTLFRQLVFGWSAVADFANWPHGLPGNPLKTRICHEVLDGLSFVKTEPDAHISLMLVCDDLPQPSSFRPRMKLLRQIMPDFSPVRNPDGTEARPDVLEARGELLGSWIPPWMSRYELMEEEYYACTAALDTIQSSFGKNPESIIDYMLSFDEYGRTISSSEQCDQTTKTAKENKKWDSTSYFGRIEPIRRAEAHAEKQQAYVLFPFWTTQFRVVFFG